MEEIRPYRVEEDDSNEERELATLPTEDEVPFHIPMD